MSRAVADPSGITQTFDSDTLTGMTNIVWDLHIYAETSGNSTNLTTAINSIGPYISTLQAVILAETFGSGGAATTRLAHQPLMTA